MDIAYLIKQFPLFVDAFFLTIEISIIGIFFSLIIGFLAAVILFFKIPFLQKIIAGYIAFFRNTPYLVQIFFLFYGLPKVGIVIPQFLVAVISLSLLGGAYMAESFRGGLSSIDKKYIESGLAIGFNRYQLTRWVILPQAITYSVPALGANAIFLVKETSILSGIAILDLTNTARSLIGMHYKTLEPLLSLVIGYALIIIPLSILLSYLEKKVRYAEFG